MHTGRCVALHVARVSDEQSAEQRAQLAQHELRSQFVMAEAHAVQHVQVEQVVAIELRWWRSRCPRMRPHTSRRVLRT
jgi:hypothetical protein